MNKLREHLYGRRFDPAHGNKDIKYGAMNEELLSAIRGASALVKIMMGPANNAAWTVCLHAHDKAKQLPQYRHEVKRAFRQSLDAWAAYER